MTSKYAKRFKVPPGFSELLKDFTKEYLRAVSMEGHGTSRQQVYEFGHKYFEGMLQERQASEQRMDPAHLRERITQLFRASDRDSSGFLDRREFKAAFVSFAEELGLSSADVRRIMAEADVNGDGVIDYNEFVPIALNLLEAMHAKRQVVARDEAAHDLSRAYLLHGMPREELEGLLVNAFQHADRDGSGSLSRQEFSDCLHDADLGLTRKEINALMMEADENDDGLISYEEFVPVCFEVLVQMASQEIKYHTAPKEEADLAAYFEALFSEADTEETGALFFKDVKTLLRQADLGLTRVQIQAVMSEAQEDEDGRVDYRRFSRTVAAMVAAMVDVEAERTVAAALALRRDGSLEEVNGLPQAEFTAGMEAALQPYLGETEWVPRHALRAALENSSLDLSARQVQALMSIADPDDEGYVDAGLVIDQGFRTLRVLKEQELLGHMA